MDEKEILKRLIKSDALFNMIHIVTQKYEILPDNKEHIGVYIEYQDIDEMRDGFVEELANSIVDWIYSSDKYKELKDKAIEEGRSESSAAQYVGRKAKQKFRGTQDDENLLIQGQMGELLLFHFIQRCMNAVPLLRKMKITTSTNHERFGSDAIHYKIENGKNIIILGEAKTYTSSYKFNEAFADALASIINTYENRRKEINLYVHEDFLDKQMDKIAEQYLNNTLKPVEVQLVSIITYNEVKNISKENEAKIKEQIEKIIEDKYKNFDKNKIELLKYPILTRITYIVFPVWNLKELAERFQKLI